MRLIELRGPDAAETQAAWARRWTRLRRALRVLFSPARRRRLADDRLEFYAEAGAPEGALYADGRLVAQLDDVRRL